MPRYPGISSEAFRHPLDLQAEQALRAVPGFDLFASKFVEYVYERPEFIYNMGNCIQVGPRQYANLHSIFREAIADLDVHSEPTLFVTQNPAANSYALGQERPFIIITSGALDLLTDEELRVVFAHELGHIKCGHTTLIQMALWAMNVVSRISDATLGIGGFVSSGLLYAFFEWRRKAELTSDRAALLVTDSLDDVLGTMMKLAGGSITRMHELSLTEFKRQAQSYQELDRENLNQIYKFMLYNGIGSRAMLSHPFPIERVHYIQQWASSEEYQKIKNGTYQHTNSGAVDTPPTSATSEAERLRQQIEDLQSQIDRLKRS
ncbi:MAG: M48 family metallopeptidase [Oscillatoriales cyanobacterium SM2_2_1]|nr:M48 family metallopeptidase [Oscillatoriales cyanobacterium SM2_2_1]